MKICMMALGAFAIVFASVAYADTAGVPTNSLLAMASDNSGDDNANMPGDDTQHNNPSGNNSTSNNPPPANYNPPIEYVVPLNPARVRGQTTVNVQGNTGTNRTGANPEGAGR